MRLASYRSPKTFVRPSRIVGRGLFADEPIDAWLQSPEHRANLLNQRWREVGIGAVFVDSAPGVYSGSPVTIVTADFGVRR